VLASSPLSAVRVVATPFALDSFVVSMSSWPIAKTVLRIAPDELLVLHVATSDVSIPHDEHAIVEAEHGCSLIALSWTEFERHVRPLAEWAVPTDRPVLAQGMVAFIPAKLWLTNDGVRIVVATPFVDTLLERMLAL
jgi:hypothetical protein